MFPKSIQWRLVFIVITIALVLITVVWVSLSFQVEEIFYNSFKGDIEKAFQNLPINESTDLKALEETLKMNPIISGIIKGQHRSFTIIDKKTNTIVFSSDPSYQESNSEIFRNEIYKSETLISVVAGAEKGEKQGFTQVQSATIYDYFISKKLSDGEVILYFKYDRADSLKTMQSFNNTIMSSLVFAIIVSVVIGFILSKTITSPIASIMHKAERITTGEFGEVLEVKSNDEIGELTRTFNYMSTQLKTMLNEISSEKNKVETILNYMTEGIVAFNLERKLIHANPSINKILDIESFNHDYESFISAYNLDIDINQIIEQSDKPIEREITVNDKYVRVQFVLFTDEQNKGEGIIVVFQDITEQQKLDNMRKEFVANVSHELRTPLTSIKSYSETLLDGAIEDRETAFGFLKVIDSEVDRMTRLVKDLLQLSRHDSGMRVKYEKLQIYDVVTSCIDRMQITAKEKDQVLDVFLIGNSPIVLGDRDRLEQLFINIISNAIKYTPDHGKVTVYVGTTYNDSYIKVIDTGIGIPEADLERIFERFYRVDKARSRQMGGTGLGLAIAKEIVLVHKGSISAKSQIDKGTEITIKLPLFIEEEHTV